MPPEPHSLVIYDISKVNWNVTLVIPSALSKLYNRNFVIQITEY